MANQVSRVAQVSSRYLELTRQKLELTRLPHDVGLPKSREWELGTPKSVIEPLIDFWYACLVLGRTLPQHHILTP